MTDKPCTSDYDVLTHCREQCANGACMSGDTCAQVMHDEPCYTAVADELTRLRAQNAALVEALRHIDALDPESFVSGMTISAVSSLVRRMGGFARASLAQAESYL